MGIVKSGGEWQITLKSTIHMRELVDNGIEINGQDIPVRCLTRNIIVVSFFGVPVYVDNNMLTPADSKARRIWGKTNILMDEEMLSGLPRH